VFGGVGLVLGVALGIAFRRWKAAVALVALGVAGAIAGLRSIDDPSCLDDCPEALGALVILTNLAGWAFGLTIGTGMAKLVRHRSIR
jgi:hypothetical protein